MRLLTLTLAAGMMMQGGAVQSDPCTKLGWGPCVESQVSSNFRKCSKGEAEYEGQCVKATILFSHGPVFTEESYSHRPEVSQAVQKEVGGISKNCKINKNGKLCMPGTTVTMVDGILKCTQLADCEIEPIYSYSCKDGDSVLFESVNGKRHICVRF